MKRQTENERLLKIESDIRSLRSTINKLLENEN